MMIGIAMKKHGNKMSAEEKKFRAESDMRTLLDAEEIKTDSARLRAAKAVARSKSAAMKKIT